MRKQLITGVLCASLVTGCASVRGAVHGHHRYSEPGLSMEPTVHRGQTVDARPVAPGKYRPRRGDIVVFKMPGWTPSTGAVLLKRVVAVAGDRISCADGGRVTLNGTRLSEPYLAPGTSETAFGPVTVPPGRLWVMGDNRPVSADSRAHVDETGHGTVPAANVVGVVVSK